MVITAVIVAGGSMFYSSRSRHQVVVRGSISTSSNIRRRIRINSSMVVFLLVVGIVLC